MSFGQSRQDPDRRECLSFLNQLTIQQMKIAQLTCQRTIGHPTTRCPVTAGKYPPAVTGRAERGARTTVHSVALETSPEVWSVYKQRRRPARLSSSGWGRPAGEDEEGSRRARLKQGGLVAQGLFEKLNNY
jgi:hypothetical protein